MPSLGIEPSGLSHLIYSQASHRTRLARRSDTQLVAGGRIERPLSGNEPLEIPLLYPAMYGPVERTISYLPPQ